MNYIGKILLGNYSKAKIILGWEPETTFEELVLMVVEGDLKQAAKESSQ